MVLLCNHSFNDISAKPSCFNRRETVTRLTSQGFLIKLFGKFIKTDIHSIIEKGSKKNFFFIKEK